MTVKEVFELRKQGRIEEAYEAIRPMYASHQGKYTTLCMFWTASDILKKRLQERRIAEAEKIFEALLRVLPSIDDKDGKAHVAILNAASQLAAAAPSFSILAFVEHYAADHMHDEDWQAPQPVADQQGNRHPLPSPAQRLLTQCFHEIQQHPDVDHALKVMPLLQEAVRRFPRHKNNQRYMAVVYRIMGEREKAVAIYRSLLSRHHDSYLYAELAELTDDEGHKAALLCQAIMNQRQEKFRAGYRFDLARMLLGRDDARAAHELQKCIATRKALGYAIPHDMQTMLTQLAHVTPATDAQQQDFYIRMAKKYPV